MRFQPERIRQSGRASQPIRIRLQPECPLGIEAKYGVHSLACDQAEPRSAAAIVLPAAERPDRLDRAARRCPIVADRVTAAMVKVDSDSSGK
jgi:hypothetical protein